MSPSRGPAAEAWQREGDGYRWDSPRLAARLDPATGLAAEWRPGRLALPRLLAVEIVDARGLGARPLVEPAAPPESYARQDTVIVLYKPTAARPVECDCRWRIGDDGRFELEVSTLTPGQWGGLSVETSSTFAGEHLHRLGQVGPLVYAYRPPGADVSYVEMCHPHDGIGLDLQGATARFRLFGHDLEKGVILRGRLRGLVLPRADDEPAARRHYELFLHEPPHLSG
jgi:hypothetical protein